jgi:hypothetical protein
MQSGKLQHWDSARYYSANYYGSPDWEMTQKEEMRFHNASVTPDAIHESYDYVGSDGEDNGNNGSKGSGQQHFFRDALVADHAIRFLEMAHTAGGGGGGARGNSSDSATLPPWFLAVGFKGTHMQYQMPKRFWDMYEGIEEKLDALLDGLFASSSSAEADRQYLQFPSDYPMPSRVRKAESRWISLMQENGTVPSTQTESYLIHPDGSDKMIISRRAWKELYVFCYTIVLPSFLVHDGIFVSLFIYCCMSAFSDTT